MKADSGFTLIEVVVTLSVLAILAGMAMPLLGNLAVREQEDRAELRLERIAAALEAHYWDHGRFPDALDARGFLGQYLQPGPFGEALLDPLSPGTSFRYVLERDPDVARVACVAPEVADRFGRREVHGAVPGRARTRDRFAALAAVLLQSPPDSGRDPALSDTWWTAWDLERRDVADGFGTTIRLELPGYRLHSAGADRKFGTEDDLRW